MAMKSSFVVALIAVCAAPWLATPGGYPTSVDDASVHRGTAALTFRPATAPRTRVSVHSTPVPDVRSALAAITHRALLHRIAANPVPHPTRALRRNLALHAVGTQLYTAWQQPMTLKAINWFGFEYAPFIPDGLDRAPLDSILGSLRALGFNALRITFADETVESNPIVTAGLAANRDLRGLHSLDIMQRIIERAHTFGLRVILCNSRSEAGRGPEIRTGLWYTNRYPESSWENDWKTLVSRFRRDSAFVGADLRNEPHIVGTTFDENAYFIHGPLWGAYHGTYYHDRDWHYAAQTLGDELLAINPHLLIIVEGVQIYLDPDQNILTGGLWGSNLEGVQYDPIVLSRPGQLVYSIHEYGPHMWQGNWFNPHTTYQSLAARWNQLWGYLLTASRALQTPIFVGEFGTCHEYWACVSSDQGWKQGFWLKSFVRYLGEHPQVGWAYWALNPAGPFHPDDVDSYSLVSLNWRHYFPLLVSALGPILHEPSGFPRAAPRTPVFTAQPGCPPAGSCAAGVGSSSIVGHRGADVAPPGATSIQLTSPVSYVTPADSALSGRLYLPRGPGRSPRPAVVIVSGSTWTGNAGTPATAGLARSLAWHGYVTYVVGRPPVAPGGLQRDIQDVKAAAGYLTSNARRWRIDPARIGVIGFGSGGYLAMMAAYAPNTAPFAPHFVHLGAAHIAAVAGFFAPSNLASLMRLGTDPAELQAVQTSVGIPFAQRHSDYVQDSPSTYVDTGVPTILFDGIADPDAPFGQTFRLYKALKQRAITSYLIDLAGAPHTFDALPSATRRSAVRQLVAFFDGVFSRPVAGVGATS